MSGYRLGWAFFCCGVLGLNCGGKVDPNPQDGEVLEDLREESSPNQEDTYPVEEKRENNIEEANALADDGLPVEDGGLTLIDEVSDSTEEHRLPNDELIGSGDDSGTGIEETSSLGDDTPTLGDDTSRPTEFRVTIELSGTLVALSTDISMRANGTGPNVDHVSFYRISAEDAHFSDRICSYPGAWETISHDFAQNQWKSWLAPYQLGDHFVVVNLKGADNQPVCSGTWDLVQSLFDQGEIDFTCPAMSQPDALPHCEGGYKKIELLIPNLFGTPWPHPNMLPYQGHDYTAKFYRRMPWGTPEYIVGQNQAGEIYYLVVWSGPWVPNRFVSYQKYFNPGEYPIRSDGSYFIAELEKWNYDTVLGYPGQCDGELGSGFACHEADFSPASWKGQVFADNNCQTLGVTWPNNQQEPYKYIFQYRLADDNGSCNSYQGKISTHMREWWGDAGSEIRIQKCDEYLPGSLPDTNYTNQICKQSLNVGLMIQRYSSASSRGCEMTIYSWGNPVDVENKNFRNGELLFSDYIGLAFDEPHEKHHVWDLNCLTQYDQHVMPAWFYTGSYQIDVTQKWDTGE